MKTFLRKVANDPLIRHSGLMFGSSLGQNGLNFVFWLAMVRLLAPVQYGVLNALVAFVSFFSMNGSVLQTVITRFISLHAAKDERREACTFITHMARLVGLAALGLIVISLVFGRSIISFLRLTDVSYAALIASSIFFSMALALVMGSLQGLQRFSVMAANSIIMSATKLGTGVLLVLLGWGAGGAFLGFIVAFLVSLCFCYRFVPPWLRCAVWLRTRPRPMAWNGVLAYFVPVFLSTLSFYLFTNADIVLVKHYFSPLDAGYYSVGQIIGKVALFFPSAVGLVMFPKVVDAHARAEDVRSLLAKSLLIVGFLCGPVVCASFLWPVQILGLLAGKAPAQAVSLVRYFALSMSCYAIVQILMLFHLSRHHNNFIYVLTGAAFLQVAGIAAFHRSLVQVVGVLVVISASVLAWGLVFSLRRSARASG